MQAGGTVSLGTEGPYPVIWDRSKFHHTIVFVTAAAGVSPNCKNCVFNISKPDLSPGCSEHACLGGIWITEHEAVVLRLET